ncbi:MAG: Holliday junction branch migration protein RuvA [Christensenellales bacterium]
MELFGFASRQERAMFKKLCQVTGVGAKTALGVLSALPMRDLSVAIVTGDVTALSRAPGIGKKTAQRIVLELKDKVEQQDVSVPCRDSAAPVAAPVVGDAQREAQAALQALGYTSAEAARAINLVRDQADTVDALIMLALRQIGSL